MEYLITELEQNRLRLARFSQSGRKLTLMGTLTSDFTEEQGLEAILAEVAASLSGTPRIILCLPAGLFAQRRVEMPLKDLRKVREIMPAHLQGELALPQEEVIFDVLPAGEGSYSAFWIRRSDVEREIERFRSAGLEPAVVTAAPLAWPFLEGVPADCIVFDGAAVALLKGGRLVFIRHLSGSDSVRELPAMLSALEYSDHGVPDQLLLLGVADKSELDLKGLPVTVAKITGPGGETADNAAGTDYQQLAGLRAVAAACQAKMLPDFRKGELAWTAGDALLRRKLTMTAILAAMVVLLLFGTALLKYRQLNADLASLNSSIAKIYHEIFPGRSKAVDELSEIRGEIRRLGGASGGAAVLDLLKKIAELKGSAINGAYEVELDGITVTIKGDARNAQAATEFKHALAPLMSVVELGEVKSKPDGSVNFVLTATLREAAR